MPDRALVLDANILVRSVLGRRTRELIEKYAGDVTFFVPETAIVEAKKHLPILFSKRGADPTKALELLNRLCDVLDPIGTDIYGSFETITRQRLASRDPEDWPMLASALALACPIWTEDRDFFGCGVATWTTASVEDFLKG